MPENPVKPAPLPNPFAFSQSSLQDYVDCNRRFQLRYMEQLQWPAVETAPLLENERHQLEGQQFHRLLQQYLLGLPVDKLTHMANNSGSQNLARWWDNFISARLTGNLADLDGQALHAEQSLSAPVGSHRAIAKYDLIAIRDGQATIYDWKTNHRRPRDEQMQARYQTLVYMNLLVRAGTSLNGGQPFQPEQIKMVYWYADFPSEPASFHLDSPQHARAWQSLTELASEISARQSFPLTGDEQKCGFCLYRSYCERGTSAAQDEDPFESSPANHWDVNLEQIQEIEF